LTIKLFKDGKQNFYSRLYFKEQKQDGRFQWGQLLKAIKWVGLTTAGGQNAKIVHFGSSKSGSFYLLIKGPFVMLTKVIYVIYPPKMWVLAVALRALARFSRSRIRFPSVPTRILWPGGYVYNSPTSKSSDNFSVL
jgi:hypothetical protein